MPEDTCGDDLDVIGVHIESYFLWLADDGGVHPDELLSLPLTPRQRRLLLDRMNQLNCLWGLTAPLRADARKGKRSPSCG